MPIIKPLGQHEKLMSVIVTSRGNIHLITRTPLARCELNTFLKSIVLRFLGAMGSEMYCDKKPLNQNSLLQSTQLCTCILTLFYLGFYAL